MLRSLQQDTKSPGHLHSGCPVPHFAKLAGQRVSDHKSMAVTTAPAHLTLIPGLSEGRRGRGNSKAGLLGALRDRSIFRAFSSGGRNICAGETRYSLHTEVFRLRNMGCLLVDTNRRDMGGSTRGNYCRELEHFADRRGMGWVTMVTTGLSPSLSLFFSFESAFPEILCKG